MKCGDFVTKAPKGRPHNVRPIEFLIVDPDDGAGPREPILVKAGLTYIRDSDKLERAAKKWLDREYKEGWGDAERAYAVIYERLYRCVVDLDCPSDPFFKTVDQVRLAVLPHVAVQLAHAHDDYMATEFPELITPAEQSALEEEARQHFLPDLVARFGWRKVAALARSLSFSPPAPGAAEK